MTVLTQAFTQWANRPADQRFSSLEDLHAAVTHHREVAVEARNIDLSQCRVTTLETGNLNTGESAIVPVFEGPTGRIAKFTHWSFGQVCRRIGAPASYLRTLPAGLASSNINNGLRRLPSSGEDEGAALLFAQNGDLVLRAALTQDYTRIWNSDITSRLIKLTQDAPEWQPAPAAFDGSRGLYASEKDIFCFLVDNERRIFESLPGGGLGRGFFVSNSEVGDKSFWITTFLYEYVCGNHRVWGAQGVQTLRIPHIGNADERAFGKLTIELQKFADSSAADTEEKIRSMRVQILGATKDEILDAVFKLGVTKKVAAQAYDVAVENEDRYGNPHSVWGFTGGLTQVARDLPNADARVELEKKAGKIMQIAF